MVAEPERRFTTADFAFDLPESAIAQHPSATRGASRLLLVQPDGLSDLSFPDLSTLIPPGDLLVLNTTRVRHARLLGTRPSGAPAELLLIHPAADDGSWIAMGKPGHALRPGKRVMFGDEFSAEVLEVLDEGFRRVRFIGGTAEQVMDAVGRLPLPPYIARTPDADDETRYQTVYAERAASVAAPTAGLHFTDAMLAALEANGVIIGKLELDVGPGTFKPVETDDLNEHQMHEEAFFIPELLATQICDARARGAKVWAVGTTVVRALESVAHDDGTVTAGSAATAIFITPGFRFRVVNRLITNFHLPRSTLLMLVSAFTGFDRTMAAYRHAVASGYRFYSYGDAMVIIS